MLLFCAVSMYAATAKYCVLVKDRDSGNPITNATVEAMFRIRSYKFWDQDVKTVEGKEQTDDLGMCEIKARGDFLYSFYYVTAPGYYRCDGENIRFTNKTGVVFQRWEPWNLLRIITLQKIGKQIPMYGKRLLPLSFPSEKPPWGYDLLKADWTSPYGKGEVADIVFNRTYENLGVEKDGQFTSDLYHRELIMSFPGEDNGLILKMAERHQGVRLKEAPLIGYKKDFMWFNEFRSRSSGYRNNKNSNQCFYFRIRAERNEKGEIIKALYGKIVDINAFGNKFKDINFTYFVNPTPNDRNLEFDGKNNLFNPDWRDPSYKLGVP